MVQTCKSGVKKAFWNGIIDIFKSNGSRIIQHFASQITNFTHFSAISEIWSRISFRFESKSQDWIRVPESQIRIWTLYLDLVNFHYRTHLTLMMIMGLSHFWHKNEFTRLWRRRRSWDLVIFHYRTHLWLKLTLKCVQLQIFWVWGKRGLPRYVPDHC